MDHMRAPFTWGAALVGNGLMWAQSVNVGAIGLGITGIGFALVAVYASYQEKRIKSYRDMEQARIDMKAEEDRKLGPGLSRQLAAISEQLKAAHEAVVEAQKAAADAKAEAADARHELMDMIRSGNDRAARHTAANRDNIVALQRHIEESERHMDDLVTPAARDVETVKAKVENIEKIVTGSGIIQIPPGLKGESPEARQ